MEFLVLWSGITHSVLGAHVISTCYIKKIVNCAIKQSGKDPQSVVKRILIYLYGKYPKVYKCYTITITNNQRILGKKKRRLKLASRSTIGPLSPFHF